MFIRRPGHTMTELLQQGLVKLNHNAKIPGQLLQEAFPDFQGSVSSSRASHVTALIILGYNHWFPDFYVLLKPRGQGLLSSSLDSQSSAKRLAYNRTSYITSPPFLFLLSPTPPVPVLSSGYPQCPAQMLAYCGCSVNSFLFKNNFF